jgi:hypothetical protein
LLSVRSWLSSRNPSRCSCSLVDSVSWCQSCDESGRELGDAIRRCERLPNLSRRERRPAFRRISSVPPVRDQHAAWSSATLPRQADHELLDSGVGETRRKYVSGGTHGGRGVLSRRETDSRPPALDALTQKRTRQADQKLRLKDVLTAYPCGRVVGGKSRTAPLSRRAQRRREPGRPPVSRRRRPSSTRTQKDDPVRQLRSP